MHRSIAFVLFLAVVTSGPATAKKQLPTLAETMTFIVESLNSTAFTVSHHGKEKAAIDEKDFCRVRFTDRGLNTPVPWSWQERITDLNLRTIELKTIRSAFRSERIQFGESVYTLEFRTSRPIPITTVAVDEGKRSSTTTMESSFQLSVNASQNVVGERVATALIHAVQLCGGGSKAPF